MHLLGIGDPAALVAFPNKETRVLSWDAVVKRDVNMIIYPLTEQNGRKRFV